MMKTKLFFATNYFPPSAFLFAILILSGCKKEIQQSSFPEETSTNLSRAAVSQQSGKFVPNEILVKFKEGISDDFKLKAFAKIGGNVSERILTKAMQRLKDNEGVYLLHTPLAALEAISKIKGIEIEYAEPNYVYQHDATSNDTYFTNGSLWGMYGPLTSPANQYGSRAATAWASGHTGSASVIVGVIDEGAMYGHEDLTGNFWVNPYDPVDGIDNDGNGYKDDIHGWDFDGNNNSTFDGVQDDHGTHVSGTIGGKGGNGKGVAGINWNVNIVSAKFLGNNGGTTANAIKAVDYITDLKTRHGLNIVATNNSWGGGGFSQALQDAIERANTANILFVAAAGNDGANIDATASYPAGYPNANIISVAAITSTGGLASFSNYGATQVDLGAPGSGVYSTVPVRKGNKINSSYASYSGTSMATPHVTGAAALYASTHPGSTAAAIKAAILNSAAATPTPSLSGKCVTGGRLNVSGF
ncbi:MAG: S8 family peptidase [Ginsengibacter sp.]